MVKRRWLISLVCLFMVLAFVLTACSSGKNESASTTDKTTAEETTTEESSEELEKAEEQPKEKVTFTMFVAVQGEKDVNTNETKIGKILEEQTGVNFQIEHLVEICKLRSEP